MAHRVWQHKYGRIYSTTVYPASIILQDLTSRDGWQLLATMGWIFYHTNIVDYRGICTKKMSSNQASCINGKATTKDIIANQE